MHSLINIQFRHDSRNYVNEKNTLTSRSAGVFSENESDLTTQETSEMAILQSDCYFCFSSSDTFTATSPNTQAASRAVRAENRPIPTNIKNAAVALPPSVTGK